jgi:hypothetical protein
MPGFFSVGQVLVVWRKSRAFSEKALLFPKMPGFLIIRGIPSMFWKSRACFISWNDFIVVIVIFLLLCGHILLVKGVKNVVINSLKTGFSSLAWLGSVGCHLASLQKILSLCLCVNFVRLTYL